MRHNMAFNQYLHCLERQYLSSDALAVCGAHRGLPVGFLLLRYSVLFTVESLSLLFSFFYLDLYVLGDFALISMQTKYLCVLIHI